MKELVGRGSRFSFSSSSSSSSSLPPSLSCCIFDVNNAQPGRVCARAPIFLSFSGLPASLDRLHRSPSL